jgi:hypothetical protein
LNAAAFKVLVVGIVTGALYVVENSVGSLPSVVYLIVTFGVPEEIVTVGGEEYGPAMGVKVGVAAFIV